MHPKKICLIAAFDGDTIFDIKQTCPLLQRKTLSLSKAFHYTNFLEKITSDKRQGMQKTWGIISQHQHNILFQILVEELIYYMRRGATDILQIVETSFIAVESYSSVSASTTDKNAGTLLTLISAFLQYFALFIFLQFQIPLDQIYSVHRGGDCAAETIILGPKRVHMGLMLMHLSVMPLHLKIQSHQMRERFFQTNQVRFTFFPPKPFQPRDKLASFLM